MAYRDLVERSVSDIGDELQALPPAAFTAARDRYVAQARAAGDATAAKQLAAMKRPSVGAWLVNLIALRRPDALAELLDLGAAMRAAQADGGAQLRDLSARRRWEIDTLRAAAGSLAEQAGAAAPTRAQLAEVEATLSAALVDDDLARRVRSGRLLKAAGYGGFGPLGSDQPSSDASRGDVPSGGAPRAGVQGGQTVGSPTAVASAGPKEQPAGSERTAAERARAAAQDRVVAARRTVADATAAEAGLAAEADRISAQIAQWRERLDDRQREARQARQARLAAERELASAERRLARLP